MDYDKSLFIYNSVLYNDIGYFPCLYIWNADRKPRRLLGLREDTGKYRVGMNVILIDEFLLDLKSGDAGL